MSMIPSFTRNPYISIALATFEGQKFLEKQLESILKQTRLPDEVIVYDDASSDGTVALLKSFKNCAPFRVKIIEGTVNVGVNQSFSTALAACEGTYIFLCDQDDVWEVEKIAVFMTTFEKDSNIGMVFCDASQIDDDGNLLPQSLWQSVGFTARKQSEFERDPITVLLRSAPFTYGMASGFRSAAIQPFCPVLANQRGMTHDNWFAIHTAATGWKAAIVRQCLVRYRRHINQATKKIGLRRMGVKSDFLKSRQQKALAHIEALELIRVGVSQMASTDTQGFKTVAVKQINEKIKYLLLRKKLRECKSPLVAARCVISKGYWIYAKGPVSVVRDLMGL